MYPNASSPPPSPPRPVAVSPARFARDAMSLLGAQGVITIVAVGTSIITTRALGPEGRGNFGLALLFASALVTFTDFGIGWAGVRYAASRAWPAPAIFASHALAGAVRVLITGVVGLVLIAVARDMLFPGVPAEFLVLGLLMLIPTTVAMSVLPLLLGLGRAATYSSLLLLSSSLAFGALGVAWLLLGLDVRTALIVEAAAGTVTSVAIWSRVSRAAGGLGRPSGPYLRAAYRFGIGVYTSSVGTFVNTRLVLLLVNGYIGAAGVGLYTLAQTAADRIYMLADGIGTILLPSIAEDPERNSTRLTPLVFRVALLVGGAVAIALAVVAEWFVRILYSDAFADAVPTLRLLLVAAVLSSGWRVLSQDLNGRGRSGLTAGVNGVAAAVNLALAMVLLPRIGLEGAAWSSIASGSLALLIGVWLFGRHGIERGAIVLLVPGARERAVAGRLLRGLAYAAQMGPDFWWALMRAYLLDGFALRVMVTVSPARRRLDYLVGWLGTPAALRRARSLQVRITARCPSMAVVQIDELGLPDAVVKSIRTAASDCEMVVLGEFDHYGWLVPTFAPIEGMCCTTADRATPRGRSRVLLVATPRGVAFRKEYSGRDATRRFLDELGVLERLRGSGARVPEVLAIDVSALALTETFVPGPDLEQVLEAMGAGLTGASIRERVGSDPSAQAVHEEYLAEGARFAARLDPVIFEGILQQVRLVHRHGVKLHDIKYGNVIIHRDTGLPYLIDFDSCSLHDRPQGLAFLVERDRDIELLNRAFGTEIMTYRRLQNRLRSKEFPASDRVYASSYIGHGLHIGPLWDRSTGFGRWHYILKRRLRLSPGARVLSLGPNNGSIELHLLRAGANEVVAYEADEDYAAQGRFLAEAYEWADNCEYRLRYVVADMRQAAVAKEEYDCVLALCSLYYLPEEEMRRVARAIADRSPRLVLQCNIREEIGREDADQYRRASSKFAIDLLREAGFTEISVAAPRGYSRPLVEGRRQSRVEGQGA